MTGEIDYVSDGHIVIKSTNGHALLGSITGSGCMVGATVATFCGAASMDWARSNKEKRLGQMYDGDMLQATLGG
jgi:thiamine-phosphate diphosphorylase / hydroxyethylthiazole kinase